MAFGPFVFGVVTLCELAVILFSDYKTLLNIFIYLSIDVAVCIVLMQRPGVPLFEKKRKKRKKIARWCCKLARGCIYIG